MMNQTQKAATKFEFSGIQVKYSPFVAEKIAFTCSENFGIVGKGKLIILEIQPNGTIKPFRQFDHVDAVFDCSWSELNDNLIFSAVGDGSINMFDIQKGLVALNFREYNCEVTSIECSHKNPDLLLASGNDGVIKLFNIQQGKSVETFKFSHKGAVQKIAWHPVNDSMFASVGQDGGLKIWDLKSQNKTIATVKAHNADILGCDFNKYEEQIATCSTDKTIKLWDIRKLSMPVNILAGHRYPVRTVKYSPHNGNIIASGSYDMNVNIWDISDLVNPLKFEHKKHTEFVIGVDFNLYKEKQLCSTSWDGRVLVWDFDQEQPTI